MTKRTMILSMLLGLSLAASAGKEERDFMKNEVGPAVQKAQDTYKKSCGCALKITIDEGTIKLKDEMYQAKHSAESIAENAPGYCTDESSKKAVCQMKTLTIAKGAESKFTFKGGAGTITTDGQSYVHWDMITRELDK